MTASREVQKNSRLCDFVLEVVLMLQKHSKFKAFYTHSEEIECRSVSATVFPSSIQNHSVITAKLFPSSACFIEKSLKQKHPFKGVLSNSWPENFKNLQLVLNMISVTDATLEVSKNFRTAMSKSNCFFMHWVLLEKQMGYSKIGCRWVALSLGIYNICKFKTF